MITRVLIRGRGKRIEVDQKNVTRGVAGRELWL